MPSVNSGESRESYVKRCVPVVMKESGHDANSAVGKCEGMYDEHLKKSEHSVWDTSYINDLPDSSFAYIEPGGEKDKDGKTVPRGLRHFPYKDSSGKVDLAHLRNALARAPQSPFGDKAMAKLKKAAVDAGVGDYEAELKEYTFECSLQVVEMDTPLTSTTLTDSKPVTSKEGWVTLKAVAVVGDRMMKNVFVPYESLKKSIDMWNGTYHDLNHMGTSYPDTSFPFKRQNIDYIVGYQNNAVANDQTKEIQMDVNINKNAPKYASWKSFVDINKEANKIPNVSMSIMARSKRIRAKDLNFDASSYGFKDDDMIDCLYDIYPKALTTCIEGECNSTKGCGLAVNHECDDCKCKDGKCKVDEPLVNGVNDEDAKKIALIKNRINKIKEEKNNE